MTNEEPKKLYLLPNGLISYCRTSNEDIEYTCTDALIDKACEWIEQHLYDEEYLTRDNEGTWVDADWLIKGFKQAMKGG